MTSDKIFSRLGRVTTTGNFIPVIDGLRFIAIGTVVLFHVSAHPFLFNLASEASQVETFFLQNVIRKGFYGVQLFFVISGFILALPFASHYLDGGKPVQLRKYYLRRVTRLEPPYLFSMLIIYIGIVFFKNQNYQDLLPHLAASLGYLHNIIYSSESVINNVAWSLEIEIQFYLIVPLVTRLFIIHRKIYRRGLLIALIGSSVILHWFVFSGHAQLSLTVLNFLQFFLVGFLLADIFIADWKKNPNKSMTWDFISLMVWISIVVIWNLPASETSSYQFDEKSLLQSVLFPAAILVAYCGAFRGRYTHKILSNVWITTIGGMCYSIYLLHNYIIGASMRILPDILPSGNYSLTFLVFCLVLIPIIVIISGVYFIIIERPCMDKNWPGNFSRFVRTKLKMKAKVSTH